MSEDKGSINFKGVGHQFKTKARTYQSIANDLRDVIREHEEEMKTDGFTVHLKVKINDVIEMLEDAAGRELDRFNDND